MRSDKNQPFVGVHGSDWAVANVLAKIRRGFHEFDRSRAAFQEVIQCLRGCPSSRRNQWRRGLSLRAAVGSPLEDHGIDLRKIAIGRARWPVFLSAFCGS